MSSSYYSTLAAHTAKMSTQSVQTFGRKYVHNIVSVRIVAETFRRSRMARSLSSRASFVLFSSPLKSLLSETSKGRCARNVSFRNAREHRVGTRDLPLHSFFSFTPILEQKNCRCRRARQTREGSYALERVAHRAREDGITQN